jgi:hypothetical protein
MPPIWPGFCAAVGRPRCAVSLCACRALAGLWHRQDVTRLEDAQSPKRLRNKTSTSSKNSSPKHPCTAHALRCARIRALPLPPVRSVALLICLFSTWTPALHTGAHLEERDVGLVHARGAGRAAGRAAARQLQHLLGRSIARKQRLRAGAAQAREAPVSGPWQAGRSGP